MGTARIGSLISFGVLLTLLSGCASDGSGEGTGTMSEPVSEAPTTEAAPVEPTRMPEVVKPAQAGIQGTDLWVPETTRSGAAAAAMKQLAGEFYFDFDQAIVKRAGHTELKQHADYLAQNRNASVRLEGHADERGTREYNLALGERRANAVSAFLRSQGAMSSQIEVISYGEEKPAAMGHDQGSWAKNRRVEIIYR